MPALPEASPHAPRDFHIDHALVLTAAAVHVVCSLTSYPCNLRRTQV